MIDKRLALIAGIDIPIPECGITAHQPRIKEIAYLGETEFFSSVQLLCIDKEMLLEEEDKTILSNSSNFQLLMTILSEKDMTEKKEMLSQLFIVCFPNYKVNFTPRSLLFRGKEETHIIDDNNFDAFQTALKEIFCISKSDKNSFNPANEKAKEIAKKLMRGRQRVAELKGETQNSLSQYISTLTVGLSSMSLNEVLDLTLYQLYDLIERYSLYINWDIDIRSRLAGATPDDAPENWMKNIH